MDEIYGLHQRETTAMYRVKPNNGNTTKNFFKCLIAKRQNKCNGGVCRWEMNLGKVQFVAKNPTS